MNQMTKKRSLFTVAAAFVLILSLTACSFSDFDAKRYVQGCLDALTKEKFDDYVEMTNSTKEEAQKEYDERMDKEISSMGISGISDEMEQKYRDLFKSIYGKCKYEVGEAVKNSDDSYTVPVTTYKLTVFEGCMTEMQAELTKWAEKVAKEGKQPSDSEITEKTMQILLDCINKNLEKDQYAEAVKVDVTVKKSTTDSNTYVIDDSDYEKVMNACVDMDKMTSTAE